MSKYHVTYKQVHRLICKSADSIKASGFEPDLILAIGGGGFIPARILRTYLGKPIISVALGCYDSDYSDAKVGALKVYQWLDDPNMNLSGKKVLLVDEIDDTRTTLEYCLTELLQHNPAEIAVFVLHNKDKLKKGKYPDEIKHVFVGENVEDKWIDYPWDAKDIDEHERMAY